MFNTPQQFEDELEFDEVARMEENFEGWEDRLDEDEI